MNWTDLTTAEPRLADIEAAATATLLGHENLTPDEVYVMAKPYIAQLVGWRRGLATETKWRPPAGSPLARYAATARPFHSGPFSPLDGDRAYTIAVSHIQERLFDLADSRAA